MYSHRSSWNKNSKTKKKLVVELGNNIGTSTVLMSSNDFSDFVILQIRTLFMKIDSSSDGKITWDEFCTYMQVKQT